jgi:hypothetical protein
VIVLPWVSVRHLLCCHYTRLHTCLSGKAFHLRDKTYERADAKILVILVNFHIIFIFSVYSRWERWTRSLSDAMRQVRKEIDMEIQRRRWAGMAGLLSLSVLIGCGGGSQSGTALITGSRATLLITDSFREDYAHVWATIYHVEVTPQTGTPTVLFDDPTGRLIDLKTLRDISGERFSFLGTAAIPDGTYTGISVTVGKTMELMRNGANVGDPLTVDTTLPVDTNGNPILALTFTTPKVVSSSSINLIVDFDLARFVVRNSNVIPSIKEGDSTNLNRKECHNADGYSGTVSNLSGTAPDLTFTLTRRSNMTMTVTTTASTAVSGTGTLANGSFVEVTGTLDPTAQTLIATALEVPANSPHTTEAEGTRTPRAGGTASRIDTTAGTFVLTIDKARGFMPSQTTVNIVTNSETAFRADNGTTQTAAEFFTALAATPYVTVDGAYDIATNTLTATRARVVDTTQDGGWLREAHGFRRGKQRSNWGNGVVRE